MAKRRTLKTADGATGSEVDSGFDDTVNYLSKLSKFGKGGKSAIECWKCGENGQNSICT